MKWQQLMCFKEVAETQSFTRAAKNMYIAQPGVSYNIRTLEKELGVPLFERDFNSKNRSVLTSYGKALYPSLTEALEVFEEARLAMEKNLEDSERRVIIGMSSDLVPGPAYELIRRIKTKCQDIPVDVVSKLTVSELQDELTHNRVHIAIYPDEPDSELLKYEEVFRMPLYAYVPKNSDYGQSDRIHLSELSRYPLIYPHNARKQLMFRIRTLEENEESTLCRSEIKSRYMSERLLYVSLGQGYTIGSAFPYDETLVSRIRLQDEKAYMSYYMIWDSRMRLNKEQKKVLYTLKSLAPEGAMKVKVE